MFVARASRRSRRAADAESGLLQATSASGPPTTKPAIFGRVRKVPGVMAPLPSPAPYRSVTSAKKSFELPSEYVRVKSTRILSPVSRERSTSQNAPADWTEMFSM